MAGSSKTSVIAGISANTLITGAKFVGFALSGSGAMLSEAIHSAADTANQSLLLFGLKRAEAPPTPEHPYGFGRERFFWGLVSALGIFFLGAGVTLYHGIHSLLHPEQVEYTGATWVILGFAAVIEGGAGFIALAGITREARADGISALQFIREGRDPTAIAVLYEDGAAILGVFIAAACMGLSKATGWLAWDAIGAILVGLLLAVVAIVLIAANRRFLLTKTVDAEVAGKILAVIHEHGAAQEVRKFRGVVHALDRFRITADVRFDAGKLAGAVLRDGRMERIGAAAADPEALRAELHGFAGEVITELERQVDDLEARIRAAVPEAKDVDIEAG